MMCVVTSGGGGRGGKESKEEKFQFNFFSFFRSLLIDGAEMEEHNFLTFMSDGGK